MRSRIRVGAVTYLNSKPLVEGLTDFGPDIDLSFDLPSRLADQLADGDIDVGLIPVIEYFRGSHYTYIPNIAIASRGPVLSVTLFSKVSWDQIRSVAIDEGSRTSAALTQIVLERRYGVKARYVPLAIDASAEEAGTDAVLLIGDRAMRACLPGHTYAFDLGWEWADWTGLPFVYALWAVRDGVDLGPLEAAFHRAKEYGRARSGLIAHREAAGHQVDPGYLRRYLAHIIHYDLGPRELTGLRHFYDLAVDLGLAPKGVDLVPCHRRDLVQSG